MIFFFKQNTAYEMRISDWSSDVCSSDLHSTVDGGGTGARGCGTRLRHDYSLCPALCRDACLRELGRAHSPIGAFLEPWYLSPPESAMVLRSEVRRVEKEYVSTCRSRWSPYN